MFAALERHRAGGGDVDYEPPRTAEFKRFLSEHFYLHPRVLRMTRKAEWIVGDLYRVYSDDPLLLPARIRDRFRDEPSARVMADYLAGMTDPFAMAEHRKLLDPHAPA